MNLHLLKGIPAASDLCNASIEWTTESLAMEVPTLSFDRASIIRLDGIPGIFLREERGTDLEVIFSPKGRTLIIEYG